MIDSGPIHEFYGALADDDPEELYETAPCGYVSTTPSGMITKANRTFLAWTGYAADELVHTFRFQGLLAVGDRIFYETHFAPSLVMQGSVREIAVDLVCRSGVRLPVLVNAVAKMDESGAPVALRIAVFDARERRAYERELLAARRAAEDAADEARALAETLQQTLLPPSLPTVPGVDVAGSYRPAGDGSVVGGDFYDLFQIDERSWGMALGDVCGKGASAAVVTALARSTIRAEAVREDRPSAVLRGLHEVLFRSDGRSFCTALFGMLRPTDDGIELRLSAGGHHLPLLARPDGSVDEVGRSGALLGMLGPPRLHDVEQVLAPGDVLVLYTDGVTEARNGEEFFGEERLRSTVVAHRHRTAQELADTIADTAVAFQDGMTRDDIAVLVVRTV